MKKYTLDKSKRKVVNGHTVYKVVYTPQFMHEYALRACEEYGLNSSDLTPGFETEYYTNRYNVLAKCNAYVECEENLSQEGLCMVIMDGIVYGNGRVYGNAIVGGSARVYDNAKVYDKGMVCGTARICENASVYGNAMVLDGVTVSGVQCVCGWGPEATILYGLMSI